MYINTIFLSIRSLSLFLLLLLENIYIIAIYLWLNLKSRSRDEESSISRERGGEFGRYYSNAIAMLTAKKDQHLMSKKL